MFSFSISFLLTIATPEAAHPSGCFNNPDCFRAWIEHPERTRCNQIAWDMDSGSFFADWAWQGVAPDHKMEHAQNHAVYEWGQLVGSNLSYAQYDSCSQARQTGNGVTCSGVRNWCRWLRNQGLGGLNHTFGFARRTPMDGCDIPAGWKCVKETKVRYNGFSWWKTGECGLGTHTVGTPRNPRPDDQGDPRWRLTCQQTKLPSLAVMVNSTHAAVHEFGHGVVLHDYGYSCTPNRTVMEQYNECELLLPCPSQFTTADDSYAVRYLYGP